MELNNIYLTYVNKDYKCDTFFPKLEENFKLISYSDLKYDKNEKVSYRFLKYQKNIFYENNYEKKYLDIAKRILNEGNYRLDRTDTGIFSIFGTQMRFNIENYIQY